jgi:hypothetical protein
VHRHQQREDHIISTGGCKQCTKKSILLPSWTYLFASYASRGCRMQATLGYAPTLGHTLGRSDAGTRHPCRTCPIHTRRGRVGCCGPLPPHGSPFSFECATEASVQYPDSIIRLRGKPATVCMPRGLPVRVVAHGQERICSAAIVGSEGVVRISHPPLLLCTGAAIAHSPQANGSCCMEWPRCWCRAEAMNRHGGLGSYNLIQVLATVAGERSGGKKTPRDRPWWSSALLLPRGASALRYTACHSLHKALCVARPHYTHCSLTLWLGPGHGEPPPGPCPDTAH